MDDLALVDPLTGGRLCVCGLYFPPPGALHAARQCQRQHIAPPVIPGDSMRHRPDYVPAGARYVPGPRTYAPRRRLPLWLRLVVALAVTVSAVALVVLVATAYAGAHPAPATFVTPTTYGPPGPTGGPAR